jgi:hypothetical protein
MVVQPVVGALSDLTRSRWGRLPHFAVGAAFTIACLYLIATAPAFAAPVAGVRLPPPGASPLGRLLGGALLDPINAAARSPSAGYLLVYGIAGVFFPGCRSVASG